MYHKRDFPFYFVFSVVLLRRMYYRTLSLSPLSPHFLNIKHDVSSIQPIESSLGRFGSAHWTSRVTCVKQDPSLYIVSIHFLYVTNYNNIQRSSPIYQPHGEVHACAPRLDGVGRNKSKSNHEKRNS